MQKLYGRFLLPRYRFYANGLRIIQETMMGITPP